MRTAGSRSGRRGDRESIIGSRFTGWLEREGDVLVPHIRGRAWITARSTLHFEGDDPFAHGLG